MSAAVDRSAEVAAFLIEESQEMHADAVEGVIFERWPGLTAAEHDRGFEIATELLRAELVESLATPPAEAGRGSITARWPR